MIDPELRTIWINLDRATRMSDREALERNIDRLARYIWESATPSGGSAPS